MLVVERCHLEVQGSHLLEGGVLGKKKKSGDKLVGNEYDYVRRSERHSRSILARIKRWFRNPFLLVGVAVLVVMGAGAVVAQRLRSETAVAPGSQQLESVGITQTDAGGGLATPYSSLAETVAAMPLEEKVGQMMMIGFDGLMPDASVTRMIQEKHVGAVILFGRNIESLDQVTKMNASLQELAAQTGHPLKLMIATDQEGGASRRFESIGPSYSEPMIGEMQGGAGSSAAQQLSSQAARELKKLGINTNLAPVADVSAGWGTIMDTRSYGTDPQVVATLTAKAVKGYNNATTISCVKHFPGLGSADGDPEKMLPTVSSDRATLESTDLLPFKEAIKENAPMIMVTHVAVPALDPTGTPASLSRPIITDLLRKQMAFNGVIITDDLEMGAISHPAAESAVAAVYAGADIVMFAHTPAKQQEAYDAIISAVKAGKLKEDDINKSVVRILEMKKKYRLEWQGAAGGTATGAGTTSSSVYNLSNASLQVVKICAGTTSGNIFSAG